MGRLRTPSSFPGSLEFGAIGVPSFAMPCDSARGSRGGGRDGGASRGAAPIRDPAAGLRRGGRRSVPDRAVPRAFGFFGSGAPANGTNGGSRDSCSGTGGAPPSRAPAPRSEHRWRCLRASPRRAALLRGPFGVSWRDAPDGAARPSRRESGPHSLAVAPCARPGASAEVLLGGLPTGTGSHAPLPHGARMAFGRIAPVEGFGRTFRPARGAAPGARISFGEPSAQWECRLGVFDRFRDREPSPALEASGVCPVPGHRSGPCDPSPDASLFITHSTERQQSIAVFRFSRAGSCVCVHFDSISSDWRRTLNHFANDGGTR